jgi:hypothetical protein
MANGTTHTNHDKILSFLRNVTASRAALAGRVFATSDAVARQYGWHVTFTQGGLGRRYRDPRFDTLAARADGQRRERE